MKLHFRLHMHRYITTLYIGIEKRLMLDVHSERYVRYLRYLENDAYDGCWDPVARGNVLGGQEKIE